MMKTETGINNKEIEKKNEEKKAEVLRSCCCCRRRTQMFAQKLFIKT